MADEEQVQDEEQGQEPKEKSVEELIAKALQEQEKKFKSEIAGLNRAVSEKEKSIDEIKKAQMDEKERTEYEKQQLIDEKKRLDREVAEARAAIKRVKAFNELGLSEEEVKVFAGAAGAAGDDDAIIESAKAAAELKKKYIEMGKEEAKSERAKNAHVPRASQNDDALTRADVIGMSDEEIAALPKETYNAAMKRY